MSGKDEHNIAHNNDDREIELTILYCTYIIS